MCLVLGKDSTDSMRWWIDASYAVHPDMRGNTGATISMGNGVGLQRLMETETRHAELNRK